MAVIDPALIYIKEQFETPSSVRKNRLIIFIIVFGIFSLLSSSFNLPSNISLMLLVSLTAGIIAGFTALDKSNNKKYENAVKKLTQDEKLRVNKLLKHIEESNDPKLYSELMLRNNNQLERISKINIKNLIFTEQQKIMLHIIFWEPVM